LCNEVTKQAIVGGIYALTKKEGKEELKKLLQHNMILSIKGADNPSNSGIEGRGTMSDSKGEIDITIQK